MNDRTVADDDGRWMTYAELAELRGISRKAAARLTLRHGWRRQPGNDGATRVRVPETMTRRQSPRTDGPSSPLSDGGALVEANKRADAAIALAERLTVQLTEAGARADRAEENRRAAEARADRAEHALTGERARADDLRDRLDAAEALAEQAEARGDRALAEFERARAAGMEALQTAEALRQADTDRRAKGLLARLRAAWRGE